MIALDMIRSDQEVYTGQQYLARIGSRYMVIRPLDSMDFIQGYSRDQVPYKEAVFEDPTNQLKRPLTDVHELALIT